MMKTIQIISIALFCVAMISCSDNDEITVLAAFNGDEQLGPNDVVPFILHQNYPNPFNPSTTITFDVFGPANISMRVYSDDWQEVVELFDLDFAAGTHQYNFDGRDADDNDLPSGEYFYTLESGDHIQVRKMKLMK